MGGRRRTDSASFVGLNSFIFLACLQIDSLSEFPGTSVPSFRDAITPNLAFSPLANTSFIIHRPLIAVLAMVIGCSILDDAGYDDYQPLYRAARMGAVGGPIAAFFCVLVAGTFTIDEIEGLTDRDPDLVRCRRRLDKVRWLWGVCTPYVISFMGGPIGSAILRAVHLGDSIKPLSAVRAGAVGGIFATPIYYVFWIFLSFILGPCFREPQVVADEKLGIPPRGPLRDV